MDTMDVAARKQAVAPKKKAGGAGSGTGSCPRADKTSWKNCKPMTLNKMVHEILILYP